VPSKSVVSSPAICVPQDLARLPQLPRQGLFFIRSDAMHTDNPAFLNAHIVAYLVADDPPAVDWLEDMRVVAIAEKGAPHSAG
jgi:hypothetical protein